MSDIFKLSYLKGLEPFMKILIDGNCERDANGNILINTGYIRVSTDRQAESGYGLDIQEKDILSYCRSNGFSNLLLFTDDGYTGTNMDRPALKKITEMISDFNQGKSDIRINSMIVPKIDRLGRSLLGTLQFIQDYIIRSEDSKNSRINRNREDINFISISENYCRIERNNPQGKFLLMLFASLAEFDRDLIVEKLKKGRQARAASGKWMGGGILPYGYRYDAQAGILIPVPEEAEKVKEIFRLYIEEKMSPQKIADRLGFKSDRIVTQILKRKSSTGCIIHKGQEYPGNHEAIISLSRWQEAQDELNKRSVVRGDSPYMLSGLLYCGECGAKMRYQKWNKKTGECKLVCYSHQKTQKYLIKDENCDNNLFWQSDIENAVINKLFDFSYLGEENNRKTLPHLDAADGLSSQLEAEKKRLSRLYDFDDGNTDEILEEKITASKKKIRELQLMLQNESSQKKINKKIADAKNILKDLKNTWELMSGKEKQSVCRELIERIIIYKNGNVELHLKLKSYLINKK